MNNTGTANVTIAGINLLGAIVQSGNAVTTVETITTVTTITRIAQNNATGLNGASAGTALGQPPMKGAPRPQLASAVVPNYTSSFQTIASFLVLSDHSVMQPSLSSLNQNGTQVGLVIAPREEVQLLFTGKISTLNSLFAPYAPVSIVPGGQYIIQIISPFSESDDLNTTAISPSG